MRASRASNLAGSRIAPEGYGRRRRHVQWALRMEPRAVNATEPAVMPPPGNPRFAPVDGMRAVAALAVLVTHTAFLSGFNGKGFLGGVTARLDVGVSLFFVISGFLLYRPF